MGDAKELTMELISEVITFVFKWVFFPVIYIGVFALLVFLAVAVVRQAVDEKGSLGMRLVRRTVAAVLPFIVLVFVVTLDREVLGWLDGVTRHPWLVFFGGAVVVEASRQLRRIDLEIVPVLYVFVLSTIGCALLYLTIFRLATPVHWAMLSFIVGASVCITMRGFPD